MDIHDCTETNIMSYDDYCKKNRDDTGKFNLSGKFKVPSKLKIQFEEAFKLATELSQVQH